MYQNKLLCYKLCYCLGVADDTLQSDYPELHEIAKSTQYFESLKSVREFRAIARIYYTVARHSELYTPDKSFATVAGSRFKQYVEGTSIVPELIYQDCDGVQNFLCKLAEMSHQILPAVYKELKPALDYLSFEMLTRLEPLSQMEMQKIHYILRRIPTQYNIYFFASDLLNVALRDMLKTDATLRKCICTVTGRPLDKGTDTSDLAKELDKRDDGYFVSVGNLAQTYKNVYLIQKDVEPATQAQILTLFSEHNVPVNATADVESFTKLWDEHENIHEDTIVIARVSETDMTSLQEHCPSLVQIMLIPIPRLFYRKILSGEFEKVSLLSLK